MVTVLFWNINRKPIGNLVAALCHERDVDVLILAESDISEETLLPRLNKTFPKLPSRLSFFVKGPMESLQLIHDDAGVAIRHFVPPNGGKLLIAALHLSSKRFSGEDEQCAQVRRVVEAIIDAEDRVGHFQTVVVGDFNMNPFEKGMVGAEEFHAVMDKIIARKGSRVHDGEMRRFFYSPMWGRMGDMSKGPPGTYYYPPRYRAYYWNTFDQVILRPELLD